MKAHRILVFAGAVVMVLAVVSGAIAAHAASDAPHPDARRLLQTAVLYEMVHGLGVLAIGILARGAFSRWLGAAGFLMVTGVVLFCGSLWVLALTNVSLALAPVGGFALIAAWLCLAIHAWRLPHS